ncbi:MAG: hypothetical protein KF715_19620 [Candidatus Didemnitutus sp.]|nr:hypothetical protein [Candidatus Didemnitutus sp.]
MSESISRLAVLRALRTEEFKSDSLLCSSSGDHWEIRGMPCEFRPNVVAGTMEM